MGTAMLLALAGTGTTIVQPLGLGQSYTLASWFVVLLSAFAGAALATGVIFRGPLSENLRNIGYAPVAAIVCIAAALLLFKATGPGGIGGRQAAVALVLAMLALVAGIRCIDLLGKGNPLGFESYWGGLGGGGGGWRILPPTGLAILAIALAATSVALVATEDRVPAAPDNAVNDSGRNLAANANGNAGTSGAGGRPALPSPTSASAATNQAAGLGNPGGAATPAIRRR